MFKIADKKDEMNDVFKIRTDVFVTEQQVPLENEIDEFEDVSTHIIGYDENHQPIATARYRQYEDMAKIERVAVVKEQRKNGIGRQLMEFLEEQIKQEGYTFVTLNGQIQAQAFYESLGYSPTGDVFLEENIEHITMQKEI